MTIDVLLLGGRGNIAGGLRTYLPRFDPDYRFTAVDLPGAEERVPGVPPPHTAVELDIAAAPQRLPDLTAGHDLVVFLARTQPLPAMQALTDAVFEALLACDPVPLIVASSSVHACDGAYSVHEGTWAAWAERDFCAYDTPPQRLSSAIDACPTNDYGEEKAYVERWCRQLGGRGHGAVAARWGGVNPRNEMTRERGYFALWCHQEDAAGFVHACLTTHRAGRLPAGPHYFVTSANTHNIFDLELPRHELGYTPVHDAEIFYR